MLEIDHVPCGTVNCFLNRFAEGGVNVDVGVELIDSQTRRMRQSQFGEEFGNVWAHQVSPKKSSR
jgi:hypothetical protein